MAINIKWDDQSGVNPGWYVSVDINGEFHTDNQKIDFPINVDGYDEN